MTEREKTCGDDGIKSSVSVDTGKGKNRPVEGIGRQFYCCFNISSICGRFSLKLSSSLLRF